MPGQGNGLVSDASIRGAKARKVYLMLDLMATCRRKATSAASDVGDASSDAGSSTFDRESASWSFEVLASDASRNKLLVRPEHLF
jgi:hypothetical protein